MGANMFLVESVILWVLIVATAKSHQWGLIGEEWRRLMAWIKPAERPEPIPVRNAVDDGAARYWSAM